MIVVTLLAMWASMLAAPDTPVARALNHWLVVAPAARLRLITRGHLALLAGATILITIVAWAGEADGLRVAAMAVPDLAAWAATFEISALIDIGIAAIAAGTTLRHAIALRGLRGWRRRRSRRFRPNTDRTRSVNPDDRRWRRGASHRLQSAAA